MFILFSTGFVSEKPHQAELIAAMLNVDSRKRPSTYQILKSEYLPTKIEVQFHFYNIYIL